MTESNSLRKYMNLLDESLDEASLKDIASSAGNKLKAMAGDKQAQGKEEAKKLAKFFKDKFQTYKGESGEDGEEALMNFFVNRVGFTPANTRKFFADAGIQDPTKQTESIELTEALTNQQIDKVMIAASQFALKHNLLAPEEMEKIDRRTREWRNRDHSNGVNGLVDQIKSAGKSAEPPAADKPKPTDANYSIDKFAFLDALRATGIDRRHLADLSDIVRNASSFKEVANRPDVKQLAMVGFAVLKAQAARKK